MSREASRTARATCLWVMALGLLFWLYLSRVAASVEALQQPLGPSAHQSIAQQLQVFNGNESQPLELNHFKLMELSGDSLLLGARNVVYNISLSSMREQRRLEWFSSDEDVKMCRVKGKSPEQCQNYIRVLKLQAPDMLFVCGTNAYKPKCRTYLILSNAYELVSEAPGEGACPYQENQNVTSLFVDGDLYSATAAQFSGIDGLIHRAPLRTEQFNPKQLNSPNFVNSFRYGEHVYFLFREAAIEHINCGKAIYSRIARVCINDSGGATRANRERWTSFVKARLNCSIPGEYPFYFDEIQASTQLVSHSAAAGQQPHSDLLYAVFTTPANSIGGSAVCAYRMSDVLAAFEGPFKAQQDSNSNWLPVPDGRLPSPRPGSCVEDSKRLPNENLNFIKDNPLMDQAVEPVYSQPLAMMASINFRFTQIAVDAQVETRQAHWAPGMRTDVIFVSTDDGRVFKLINTHHLQAAPGARAGQQSPAQPHVQQPAPYYMGAGQAASLRSGPSAQAAAQVMPLQAGRAPQAASLQAAGAGAAPAGASAKLPDVSSSTIVIEELHLFDARTPILNLLIHYPPAASAHHAHAYAHAGPRLLVLAGRQLKAIPLQRCERAPTCADCLALFDPYCAWDARQQLCLATGRAMTGAGRASAASALQRASQAPGPQWFPPNNGLTQAPQSPPSTVLPLNQTGLLGWWGACPASLGAADRPQLVGAPFRSLFSSHLQVPSRFDYDSGHHLSHTALVSLSPPSLPGDGAKAPLSECLTFCGGVYAPSQTHSPAGELSAGGDTLAGQAAANVMARGAGTAAAAAAVNCADLVQQHYMGATSSPYQHLLTGAQLNSNGNSNNNILNSILLNQATSKLQQQQPLYTSENLYLAVIICALVGLLLGLAFGFAIGRSSKKHDSSVCSSTFDETNLYMASTGSHHGPGAGLFAVPPQQTHHQLHHHHPLLPQSGAVMTNGRRL